MSLVLVVDDEPDILRSLEMILVLEGHEVVTAYDGAEGLRRAYERVPDLIISDIMMPKLDGLAMCQRLRNDPRTRHIPIIIHSAIDPPASPCHWDIHLRKTVDIDKLLASVERLVAPKA